MVFKSSVKIFLSTTLILLTNCHPRESSPGTFKTDVAFWLTTSDKGILFAKQKVSLLFAQASNSNPTITVDTTQTFQSMDGFGYTLTGGSAYLIHQLPDDKREALLKELFLTDSTFIGVSYLRISIGASDLSASTFTYDDMPPGKTDVSLANFSLDAERADLIPVLKEILALNPAIKILGSPWSPPAWMKTNESSVGGSLKTKYYAAYAEYFVKYIQGMQAEGITIDAITPQNEPLNPKNNPSLLMTAIEQANFIKNNLGPAFTVAGLRTKIIAYDHNADEPSYPLTILKDADAAIFTDGSAFHLYGGSISALTPVHEAYPQKNIYFTEQYTPSHGNFGEELSWHMENLIIGAPRNWSRNVLEWNLANDLSFGPHTDGGCTTCLGALTIDSSAVSRNVSYYIIAHASKFVRPGSIRILTNVPENLPNVAFQRPDGKKVLIVLNRSNASQPFNISFEGKLVTTELSGGAVGTFVW